MSGVYQWREGFRFKADPNAVGAEIEMLSAKAPEGQLTPQALVDAARRSNGPLYGMFEWDDADAARQHRLEQARGILQALVVTVKLGPKQEAKPMRAFVNVVKNGQQGYRALDAAMADKELRDQVVQRAWAELVSWKQRYADYEELAVAVAAVNVAVRKRDETASQDKAA